MVLAALYNQSKGLNYENMEIVNNTEFLETVEEPFETYDDNNHYINSFQTFVKYIIMLLHITRALLGLSVVVINILLIVAICKFKRLKCKQNLYILNYVIFNTIYFVCPPMFEILANILRYKLNMGNYFIFFIIEELENGLIVFNFLFAFALSFHWLVTVLKPELGIKIKSFYKYFTLTMIILGSVISIIQVILATSLYYYEAYLIVCVLYFKILIFNSILNIMNYKRKSSLAANREYSLIISNIIIYFWLPKIVLSFFYIFDLDWNCFHCFYVIFLLADIVSFLPSVVILVVLTKKNKYLRMAFAKMFCRKSVREYSSDQENLDESEGHAEQPNTNTNISYNSSTNIMTFPDLEKV